MRKALEVEPIDNFLVLIIKMARTMDHILIVVEENAIQLGKKALLGLSGFKESTGGSKLE